MGVEHDEAREQALNQLNADMVKKFQVTPTWAHYAELIPKEPAVNYQAYLWKWARLHQILERAGELVDLERGAERRSFEVVNPALRHIHGTTHTLGAALQLVKPGEVAPSHRHLAGALRFIVQGRGSYTAVEGEKLYMEERDLILTPSWTWHDHGNETDDPIIWLDALDYPLLHLLQVSFFEAFAKDRYPETKPLGYTEDWIGLARPAWESYSEDIPLATYKWRSTYRTLTALNGRQGSPYDGILLEYVNPFRHGPILPTIAAYAQLLRPSEQTVAHRHTTSSVYFVVEGRGYSVMNGERFDWGKGDFFMIPPWTWHEHTNTTDDESLFFVISDRPIMDAFKLYREEPYVENGGHQDVVRTFSSE